MDTFIHDRSDTGWVKRSGRGREYDSYGGLAMGAIGATGGGTLAAIGLTVYSGMWAYANREINNQMVNMEISEDPYTPGSGNDINLIEGRNISSVEKSMLNDFSEIMQTPKAQESMEVAQYYKFKYKFWTFGGYAERVGDTYYFNETIGNDVPYAPKGSSAFIHSHPNYAFPSNQDIRSIAQYENLRGYIYYQPKNLSKQPPVLIHYDSSKDWYMVIY